MISKFILHFFGYPVTDDGTFGGIHDEPDIAFNSTNLNVGFISSKNGANLIIIVINERFNTNGCCFEIVSHLLMGYFNSMNFV